MSEPDELEMSADQDTTPERILVIRLGALGDFVMSLGPFAAIRAHHASAHITLLTTAPYAELGRACGAFDEVWVDTRPSPWQVGGWLALRAKLLALTLDGVDAPALGIGVWMRAAGRDARPLGPPAGAHQTKVEATAVGGLQIVDP